MKSKIEAVASNPGTPKENTRELTADELGAVSGGASQILRDWIKSSYAAPGDAKAFRAYVESL